MKNRLRKIGGWGIGLRLAGGVCILCVVCGAAEAANPNGFTLTLQAPERYLAGAQVSVAATIAAADMSGNSADFSGLVGAVADDL